MEVLVKGTHGVDPSTTSRSWSLNSCLSPKHFLSHRDLPRRVTGTEFHIMELLDPFDPSTRAIESGETLDLPSDLVFRSVGYKSVPLLGFVDAGIHFDERNGTVTNDGWGRAIRHVTDGTLEQMGPEQIPGLYCAGWLKTGPTGVIASTMQDAFTTGDAIVQDWASGMKFLEPTHCGWESLRQELGSKARQTVTWDQWTKIDAAEKSLGRERGKVREKFITTKDMLSVLS
jgi:adrenodoxin-NADP+ reductase